MQKTESVEKLVFIGLDLAWAAKNNTGAAVIEYDPALDGNTGRLIRWPDGLGDNDTILEFVNEVAPAPDPAVIAIDAPLAVPNVSGSRACDRELTRVFGKYQAGTHPANRTNLGRYGNPPGDIRGETLARRLSEELAFRQDPQIVPRQPTRQFFECYPHPATIVLFNLNRTLKYKRKLRSLENDRFAAYEQLQSLLASLSNAPSEPRLTFPASLLERDTRQLAGATLKHYEDMLDGILCAYIAFYHWWWGAEKTYIFGDLASGHIVTPISPELRALHSLP
jgi:predicted RNase H-like nuclease